MNKVKLKELGTFKNGLNFSASKVLKGCKMIGVPDFGSNYLANLENLSEIDSRIVSNDYLLANGDILFVRSNGNKALVGRTLLVEDINENVTYSGFCIRFRPNRSKVLPQYLLYLFKSPMFRKLFSNTQQTSITNLNQEVLGNIEIDLPSLEQQDKIVRVLHPITLRILTNSRINDNLQQQMKLLYNYWFVQFDFPDENGNPYRTSGGQMIWNEALKAYIPEKWSRINIREITSVTWGQCPDGKNILTREVNGNGILDYCSGAGDMKGGFVVDCQAKTDNSKRTAHKNDILVSVAGKIGDMCVVDHTISLGRAAAAFTAKHPLELPYIYLTLQALNKKMITISSGSIQKVINNDHIDDFCFPYSREIVQRFGDVTIQMFNELIRLEHENRHLLSLRDWLLPMLMNGQATINY